MPDLRSHLAAGGVNIVDDAFPAGKSGFTVKERDSGFVARGRPVDHRALGQDQTDIAFRAAAIVVGHIRARNAAR
jgi:hypothetical protein